MPPLEIVQEAERQMNICNACRYCEGYCAVWPAMERRSVFNQADLVYLANLCHDCRDCLYACQYAPPHAFAINPPQVFAQLRAETYRDYAVPRLLKGLFARHTLLAAGITLVSILAFLLYVLGASGVASIWTPRTGLFEGAHRLSPCHIACVSRVTLMTPGNERM